MQRIHKKVWPEAFVLISSGEKKFDLRLDDFEAKAGDHLMFEEWDPKVKEYTGRKIEKVITNVRKFKIDDTYWPKVVIESKGLQIFSIE
ncbi:MAG: DUF3850 domain-containing protein [Patescibacteria group bacterium]